MGGNPLY